MQRMRFEVSGKVQKVFFRAHTEKKAKELGLTGWVRNLPTGNVQGEAYGPPEALKQLEKWLRTEGSPNSRVDNADIDYEDFSGSGIALPIEFVILRKQ